MDLEEAFLFSKPIKGPLSIPSPYKVNLLLFSMWECEKPPNSMQIHIKVWINSWLAIEEMGNKEDLRIYPNPAQDILNIEHKGKPIPGYEVELYHSNGSLLVSQKIEFPQQLDIRGLPSGIYLLKITSPDGQYSTYKIIKL